MKIDPQLTAWAPELASWRQDFHAHPEIAYEEHRTAALVAERLKSFGLEVTTGIGGTGVVGTLRHGNRGGGSQGGGNQAGSNQSGGNRAIALRADMDALPMDEINEFGYRSQNPGRMHACGHDGHTTMLLAAARYLAHTRNFAGTIHFIFQPAEEGGAGALRMIEDGLLERFPFDAVFGAHNDPTLPVGQLSASPGPVMAATDDLEIRLIGRGGHAARPHFAVDPVVAGAQIVLGLQTIVSRRVDPLLSTVVSICTFHAGSATNVIPETATLSGTVRNLNPAVQQRLATEIPELINHLARAAGVEAEIRYESGYPPVINDPAMVDIVARAAGTVLDPADVHTTLPPSLGGEDFAYYAQHRPACFFRIGQNDGTKGGMPLHHPRYDFNDAILPVGAAVFAAIAAGDLAA